jgi:putative flippase GtrA
MSLYSVYAIALLIAIFLGSIWSFVDRKKPPTLLEFIAKLVARALVLFVLIVIIVGFFALISGGVPAMS